MIIELYQEDGLTPRRKGPNEFCGPCPACGGHDRFIMKTEPTGRYWCRQCGVKGDAIQYLREFRKLTYHQAAELIGKEVSSLPGRRNSHRAPAAPQKPASVTFAPPSEQWAANAEKLIVEAHSSLLRDPVKMAWLLNKRGITQQTAERFRLGWLHRNLYGDRAAWGLPEQLRDNGKPKKLFLPSGLLIPGSARLRIRRAEPGDYGKYYVVPGSGLAPLVIGSGQPHEATIGVIVESELDAILLCQELQTPTMIVAAGTTSYVPGDELLDELRRLPFVLLGFDNDPAGGKASCEKWMDALRNAWRTPIPPSWGKDHTDAYLAGHDLRVWFEAGCKIVINNP